MALNLRSVLLLVALVLFVVGAVGVTSGRFSLIAAGLAFVSAALLFG